MATAPALPTANFEVMGVGTETLRSRKDEEQVKYEVKLLPNQASPALPDSGQAVAGFMFISGDGLPQPLPKQINFGALKDPLLRVLKPIQLSVSSEEDHIVLHWPEVEEFGTGQTLSSALDDFSASLRQLYHHLHGDAKLGVDLLNVRRILDEYVAQRPR